MTAIERRDSKTLDCLLASDFLDINWQNQLKHRVDTLEGRIANVNGRNRQVGEGGKAASGVRFTDIFVYTRGASRALRAQETLIQPSNLFAQRGK